MPLIIPAVLMLAVPTPAFGQSIGPALCAVIDNNIGILSAVASLGVIIVGIMATIGRVTWTQALLVITGISVLGAFIVIVHWMVAIALNGNTAQILAARCPGW